MSLTRPLVSPVRILLLGRDHVGALHLRLAIDMAPVPSAVRVIDYRISEVHSECAAIRGGATPPQVVLVECDAREGPDQEVLRVIRSAPELQRSLLVVIGDGASPEEPERARELGARGFIARPERSGDLARVGQDLARICESVGTMPD